MRYADRGGELNANAAEHSQGGSPGGRFIVRLRHFPGHCTWGEARHEGGSQDGGLRACARDSSGLFLVLNLVSPCKVASGTAPDRVLVRCGLHRCRQLRRRGEAAR